MSKEAISCVVLAAGKGTRMKSDRAKVLHEILSRPMIHHVLDAVMSLGLARIIVVIGHQRERVREALAPYPVAAVVQEQQLGTGHAVLCAGDLLQRTGGTALIVCGDVPLIRPGTLQAMLADHLARLPSLTVMTTTLQDPAGYGRIVSDGRRRVLRIVEEQDASPAEKAITEINAGIYCAAIDFLLDALARVNTDNSQGEIYLTDIVSIANDSGLLVNRFSGASAEEVLGVNSVEELETAREIMRRRREGQ